MRTRKIANRTQFNRVFQELEPIALRKRKVGGPQQRIADLLREKRENIAYWLNPTTSGIAAKAADRIEARLKEIDRQEGRSSDDADRPPIAALFSDSLENRTAYLASIAHGLTCQEAIDTLEAVAEGMLHAIAKDGIEAEQVEPVDNERDDIFNHEKRRNPAIPPTLKNPEDGKVPGAVFRRELRLLLNEHRRAKDEHPLDSHRDPILGLFAERPVYLIMLRAILTLDPLPDAPLGVWPSLSNDTKRAWVHAATQLVKMTSRGHHDYAQHQRAADTITDRILGEDGDDE